MSERVLGLGGLFLKSRDPAALAAWYRDFLGVELEDFGGVCVAQFPPDENGTAPQVLSVFPDTSDYFPGPAMVNFRVRDLDALRAQLRARGAAVEDRVEESGFGRFGWVLDPEGRRVELWQPPAP